MSELPDASTPCYGPYGEQSPPGDFHPAIEQAAIVPTIEADTRESKPSSLGKRVQRLERRSRRAGDTSLTLAPTKKPVVVAVRTASTTSTMLAATESQQPRHPPPYLRDLRPICPLCWTRCSPVLLLSWTRCSAPFSRSEKVYLGLLSPYALSESRRCILQQDFNTLYLYCTYPSTTGHS
jgi:hypothetical protein